MRTPPIPLASGESSGKTRTGGSHSSHSTDSWNNVYEGGSSFTSQSIQAREVAESVANANGAQARSDLNTSLGHLDKCLEPSGAASSHNEEQVFLDIPHSVTSPFLPLPAGLVLAILHRIQGTYTKIEIWSSCFSLFHAHRWLRFIVNKPIFL